ncbi:Nitrogen permease regulator 3 [Candida viswanathii]|uniref:Nitrogen permease regulator 3 n=1 Tax=Candida viswanathii TaxID=5486 RepID=A0A367YBE3_9ASCO|nr:Nitrogen permease regulator 3 [Candida viswanathii]
MSFNLPNPSLVGILLVISTHSGPQLVYKYPFDLSNDRYSLKHLGDQNVRLPKDEDEDDELYDENDSGSDSDAKENNQLNPEREMYGVTSRTWDAKHLDYYLGTKLDLLRYLDEQDTRRKYLEQAKSKSEDKKKGSNSTAKPRLTKTVSKTSTMASQSTASGRESTINGEIFGHDPAYVCEMLAPPKQMCNTRFEITIEDKIFLGLPVHRQDNGQWRSSAHRNSDGSQRGEVKENQGEDPLLAASTKGSKSNLSMFHLVFVMNPPVIESNYRVDEMFHYVISRLSLVLRYEQQKHEYITNELRNILELRDQFEGDEGLVTEKSPLCRVIRDCFDSISTSTVANLSINGKLRSFQIPIKTEFHSLPDASVPFIPGSYLSSNVKLLGDSGFLNVGETSRYGQAFQHVQDDDDSADKLIIHFALLLLDEPDTIIKDMKTEGNSTLAKFIRMIEPTESLLKLSMRNNKLDISQIKNFAFHLIYWRRARVIQPLSSRSVYIASPMAPISIKLYDDISLFIQKFPMLPPLPQFLKLFSPQSRKPQQFAAVIPSKDHRDRYLQALGWLMKHGYVIQLQTFIWLKISRKIKLKVEEDIENENISKKKKSRSATLLFLDAKKIDNTSKIKTDNSSKQVVKANDDDDDDDQNKSAIDDGQLSHFPELGDLRDTLDKIPAVTLVQDDDTIILDPGRATTLERRWINKIIFEECKLSQDLIAIFYKLLLYMNGKNSLELLLLKEDIPRAELRKLLVAIEEHIISVRHW